jgi:hypothetical protein
MCQFCDMRLYEHSRDGHGDPDLGWQGKVGPKGVPEQDRNPEFRSIGG